MTAELSPTSRDRSVSLWMGIAIVLAAIAVALGPVAMGGFSYWDDEDTISLNPGFNPPTWASLANRWTRPHLHIYAPLTHTVWHVLALVSPKPPPGDVGNVIALPFKLTSLGAHAIASVLVLMILRRLVGPRWPVVAGAIAFAIHPVQVEAVAWASGLKDVLFAMFSLGCLLAYVGGEEDRYRPRGRNIALALALLSFAGLSKPTAMVVPAMLLALDVMWLRRPPAQSIARLIPFVIVAGVFAWIAWLVQPHIEVGTDIPFVSRPLVAVNALAFYLFKLFVPTNLAYDYGLTAQSIVAQLLEHPWPMLARLAAVALGVAYAFHWRRTAPLAATGVVLFLIPLVPVLGLTHFDFAHYSVVADHYLYLPMLGVAIVLAALLGAHRRHQRLVGAAAAIIALTWMALTFRQAMTWRDAASVTTQTLRVNDRSFASWSNRALGELRAGELDAAERDARRAVALSSADPQSMFVLANALEERGQNADAIEWVRKALRYSPYAAAYHHRLAVLLGKSEQFDESLEELDLTLSIDPKYPEAASQAAQLRKFLRQRQPSTTQSAAH